MVLQLFFWGFILWFLTFFLAVQYKTLFFKAKILNPFPVFLFSMLIVVICLFLSFSLSISKGDSWPLATVATFTDDNTIELLSVNTNLLYIIAHSFEGQTKNIHVFSIPSPSTNNVLSMFAKPIKTISHENIFHSFLAAKDSVYYIKENPADTFSIYRKNSLLTDNEIMVFENITHDGKSLTYTTDKEYNTDNKIFYVSADSFLGILKIDVQKNKIDLFQTFGPNPSDNFLQPRGILYHNQLLYVCDKYRVLAFKNDNLVRVYEPVLMPIRLTVWRTYVVIAAIDRTYFFDLYSAKHLYTHIMESIDVTSSSDYLFIAGKNQVQVFQ